MSFNRVLYKQAHENLILEHKIDIDCNTKPEMERYLIGSNQSNQGPDDRFLILRIIHDGLLQHFECCVGILYLVIAEKLPGGHR